MYKFTQKTLLILAIIVFFVFEAREIEAKIVINEIQISPTVNRFVELYNDSSNEVDLTGYYLQRKTSTSDKYTSFVTSTKLSGKKISANGLFLISKDSLGLESLTITESNSIQLKNSKQEVVYKVGLGESSDCGNICIPNPREGKSIQRINDDEWIEGEPTPGDNNITQEQEEELGDSENKEDTAVYFTENEKAKTISNPSIVTKIVSPKVVVAGVPFVINHNTIGYKNEKIIHDRFVWNFGDGNLKEMNPCLPFSYTYLYPGDYVLSLSYYETSFSEVPEATDRLNIKVIPSGINIISVGGIDDPYIEIENNSSHEMILNKWTIVGVGHSFVIPDGTTILPNRKIKFSPKITGFKFENLSSLSIVDIDGTLFATYPKFENYKVVKKDSNIKKAQADDILGENKNESDLKSEEEVANLNSLSSSAYNSSGSGDQSVVYFGLFLVIALGIMTIVVLRKGSENNKTDFEKELSVDDIKIIE